MSRNFNSDPDTEVELEDLHDKPERASETLDEIEEEKPK
jgi:hypothetical protein